ncbi:MAG: hypothetical protein GMKNLPBB_00208 [Myxococcota bacterium]|nr:hypothetical protein [Myxococcota bacterium]
MLQSRAMTQHRIEEIAAVYRKRLSFHETDGMKIMHHTNAPRWFEIAREIYFRKFFRPFQSYIDDDIHLAVRQMELRFDGFIKYDDPIEVWTAMTRLGRVGLGMHYRVENRRSNRTVIIGSTDLVAVDAQGRMTRLPPDERPRGQSMLVSPDEFYNLPLPPHVEPHH